MIAGDAPREASESVKTILGKYTSATGEIGANWRGDSHDSIIPQAEQFVGEYEAISSQLTSLGSACDDYIEYKKTKDYKKELEDYLPTCVSEWNDPEVVGDKTNPADIRAKIAECQSTIETLEQSINSSLDAANSVTLEATSVSISAGRFTPLSGQVGLEAGRQFFQAQGNSDNCGITSLMMATNTLLGENRFTANVDEWNNLSCYTEAIGWESGNGQAQDWLNSKGLQDQVEVTGVQNIHSKEELIEHLQNGEVVVASSTGPVFKRTDGSFANLDHYICFYGTDGTNCFANDPAYDDPAMLSGIEYNPDDLDNFFAPQKGSITLRKK